MQYVVALILLFCSSLDSFAAVPATLRFNYRGLNVDTLGFLRTHFWDDQDPSDQKYAHVFHKRTEKSTIDSAVNAMLAFEDLSTEEQNKVFNRLIWTSNGPVNQESKKKVMDAAFSSIPQGGWLKFSNEYKLLSNALGGGIYVSAGSLVKSWNELSLLEKIHRLEQQQHTRDIPL
jgi:hypothetical protein